MTSTPCGRQSTPKRVENSNESACSRQGYQCITHTTCPQRTGRPDLKKHQIQQTTFSARPSAYACHSRMIRRHASSPVFFDGFCPIHPVSTYTYASCKTRMCSRHLLMITLANQNSSASAKNPFYADIFGSDYADRHGTPCILRTDRPYHDPSQNRGDWTRRH